MRFLKEFFNPRLKCQRLGHRTGFREVREGYTKDTQGFRTVADEVTQSRPICGRCGEGLGEWKDDYRSGLNGLTLDTDKYRILDREGAVWFRTEIKSEPAEK